MTLDLQQLQNQFRQSQKTEKSNNDGQTEAQEHNFYRFYSILGSHKIRFLPDKSENNPFGFLMAHHQHILDVGDKRKYLSCNRNFTEDGDFIHVEKSRYKKGVSCPLCDASAKAYKEGDPERGKKLYRKPQYLANVFVHSDPSGAATGKVKQIGFTKSIYNQLIKVIMEPEEYLGEGELIYGTEDHVATFTIKASRKNDLFNEYELIVDRNPVKLTKDQKVVCDEEIVDLIDLVVESKDQTEDLGDVLAEFDNEISVF